MSDKLSTKTEQAKLPVIDLFAGPGGLGEGFAAVESSDGVPAYHLALSIEKDPIAHRTLELRAFFRSFARCEVPDAYYRFIRGEIKCEQLFSDFPEHFARAQRQTWCKELSLHSHAEVVERVRENVRFSEESILIGGPPCQAYSLVGRARNSKNPSYDAGKDERHTLYQEYLHVLAATLPCVFVMENVKGLLSARYEEQDVLNRILSDLCDPLKIVAGRLRTTKSQRYHIVGLREKSEQRDIFGEPQQDVRRFVVRAEEHGIPQRRHRVILIGVREDMLSTQTLSLRNQEWRTTYEALSDLPHLRSASSHGVDSVETWLAALSNVNSQAWFRNLQTDGDPVAVAIEAAIEQAFARRLGRGAEYVRSAVAPRLEKSWFKDARIGGVINHSSRSHIPEDLARYLFSSAFAMIRRRSPTLADLPRELLPDHKNVKDALRTGVFADRFRVQIADQPATTVTSHISKDGHYYIHYDPSQCRSLTVREAARLQTFPDNYFFCGPRTAQYLQVGNAVPPLLARQIGHAIATYLG